MILRYNFSKLTQSRKNRCQTQKFLLLKTGLIETLTFPDGSSYESAIRKKPVPMVKVHTLGAEGNDVGLKAHHGGVDKALFFMSDVSFDALNALLGENFDFHGSAIYGENFVVAGYMKIISA